MSKKKKEINEYCTCFEYAYMHMGEAGKMFAHLIVEECFTRPATKTSLIIPPLSVSKKIKAIKDDNERRLELQNYILRQSITTERLQEMAEKGGRVQTLFKRFFYPVTMKNKIIHLNEIPIKMERVLKFTTIYKVSKKLVPMEYVGKEETKKEAGGYKKKRGQKKSKTSAKKKRKSAKKKNNKSRSYSETAIRTIVI